MSTPNRGALLNKIYKVLKKHGKPTVVRGEQPVLESLLMGCCLENTHHATGEQVYNTLRSSFFDWNEVRVTSVKELAEVMAALPEPAEAGARLKSILQNVFESDYSFDLESLKKQNLGQAVKRLQKLEGSTPFIVAYATQVALGGHSIPLDRGAWGVLTVLGVAGEAEAKAGAVPGLERAIPKSKGQEFGSLLHEIGADFVANPFSPPLRELLLSIDPAAKERLPKRTAKKPPEPAPVKPEPAAKEKKGAEKAAATAAAPKKKEKEAAAPKKSAAQPQKAAANDGKKKSPAKKKTPAKQLSRQKPR